MYLTTPNNFVFSFTYPPAPGKGQRRVYGDKAGFGRKGFLDDLFVAVKNFYPGLLAIKTTKSCVPFWRTGKINPYNLQAWTVDC